MPSRFRSILALAGVCAAVVGPQAHAADGAQDYVLDPVHTRVAFLVEHAGFSRALGTISGSSGTLRFDRDDWRSAQLDVTVPLARLDLGDAKWNAAVLASRLLDAEAHPEARFVSRQVEGVDADHAKVCGELTLRGVTGPLCLDVTFNALRRHPLPPFRRTAGFSATATLSRKAYGIVAWPTVIGDEVSLLIEAEAIRGRGDGDTEPAPEGTEPPMEQDENRTNENEDGDDESNPIPPVSIDR
ncbi:MAG TPA: YceI family protein [Lysobacter sp.]|nr:YceI family protein [Lysobacter sp.]